MLEFTAPVKPVELEDWEGEQPAQSNEVYHGPDGFLSSSGIKHMIISPAHFKRLCLEAHLLEQEKKEAFELGTVAHSCFLENDYSTFVAMPDFKPIMGVNSKGNPKVEVTAKAQKEAFEESHQGKIILSHDQHERLTRMMEVIKECRPAQDLLKGSRVEVSFRYLDVESGLKCKFRPDILNLEKGYIADYKTAKSASPHEFAKACARLHYHISASHYVKGCDRLFGEVIKTYYFIVQEKSEPYAVAVYELPMDEIRRAHDMRAKILKKIKKCTEQNHWPDFSEQIIKLHVPGYAYEFKGEQ